MTTGLRVISGSHKGRQIHFNVKKLHADVTPERVKEALFSMISDDLADSSFLDLFSCSGQIAVEALSRGAHPVYACEKEARRAKYINELIDEFDIKNDLHFYMMNYKSFLHYLTENDLKFNYIYCDPPYVKERGPAPLYGVIARDILDAEVLSDDGVLIFQHYTHNTLQEKIKDLEMIKQKNYGNTTLSFYQII
jgi:16S rRNA (guanine966-N2)-methyltransferase